MIETPRLLLRRWREADASAHRALVCEPAVVRTLGGPPAPEQSEAVIARQNGFADATGSCFWAVEHRATGTLIGWCGVKPGPEGTPIADLPEIGWTLHPAWWRQGLAREAATASLDWFWRRSKQAQVWAITTPGNVASWGLMERLGMRRVPGGDFDHPALAKGDALRPHLTYVVDRAT